VFVLRFSAVGGLLLGPAFRRRGAGLVCVISSFSLRLVGAAGSIGSDQRMFKTFAPTGRMLLEFIEKLG